MRVLFNRSCHAASSSGLGGPKNGFSSKEDVKIWVSYSRASLAGAVAQTDVSTPSLIFSGGLGTFTIYHISLSAASTGIRFCQPYKTDGVGHEQQ